MSMNFDYDSVLGVILPVENKILPIIHLTLKLTKHIQFFTLFAENTAAVFLLVVKRAATHLLENGFYFLSGDQEVKIDYCTTYMPNLYNSKPFIVLLYQSICPICHKKSFSMPPSGKVTKSLHAS